MDRHLNSLQTTRRDHLISKFYSKRATFLDQLERLTKRCQLDQSLSFCPNSDDRWHIRWALEYVHRDRRSRLFEAMSKESKETYAWMKTVGRCLQDLHWKDSSFWGTSSICQTDGRVRWEPTDVDINVYFTEKHNACGRYVKGDYLSMIIDPVLHSTGLDAALPVALQKKETT